MKIRTTLAVAFALLALPIFCGCSGVYASYSINAPRQKPKNPAPMKFYIAGISGGFVDRSEVRKIKQALLERYPEFFTADKSKGAKVSFYWNYTLFTPSANVGSALLCGFTLGLVPCVSKNEKPMTLNAKCQITGSDGESLLPGAGSLPYSVTETQLLHVPSALLGILFNPLWKACISAGGDIETPYCTTVQESLETPFKCAPCNLPLFPAACAKMYETMSDEQKKMLKDVYCPEKVTLLDR